MRSCSRVRTPSASRSSEPSGQGFRDALVDADLRVFCLGPRTASPRRAPRVCVSISRGAAAPAALLAEIRAEFAPSRRLFLLPRSEIGREELANGLREQGAEVVAVTAYRNVRPERWTRSA